MTDLLHPHATQMPSVLPVAQEPVFERPVSTELPSIPPDREAALRRFLDPPILNDAGQQFGYGNYDYAVESGLVGIFHYDPETHSDGLLHVLIGDVKVKPDGSKEIGGFHVNPDPLYAQEQYDTFVDTSHLETADSRTRKHFRHHPFEPYYAQVTIQGHRKYTTVADAHGRTVTRPVANNMFPSEYDALAALQAVRIARDTRDPSADVHVDDKLLAKGFAPMIDGETPMPICLVMDDREEKVISAFPITKDSGYMKLTDLAIDQALGLEQDSYNV